MSNSKCRKRRMLVRKALVMLETSCIYSVSLYPTANCYEHKWQQILQYQKALLRGKINFQELMRGSKYEDRPYWSKLSFKEELEKLREIYPTHIVTESYLIPWQEGKKIRERY